MKRSTKIKLVIMGGAASALIGCGRDDEKTDALVYASIDDCIRGGQLTALACSTAYQQSIQDHERSGPRYNSREDCEAQYGYSACQPHYSNGQSWFMPMMMGFMAAKIMDHSGGGWFSGGRTIVTNNGRDTYGSRPLYRTYGSTTWRTSDNRDIGSGTGHVSIPKSPSSGGFFSRGGFGSISTARGSWGS